MTTKEKFFEDSETSYVLNDYSPIFIISENHIECYLKSCKSNKLESSFIETIFYIKNLVMDKSASMKEETFVRTLYYKNASKDLFLKRACGIEYMINHQW